MQSSLRTSRPLSDESKRLELLQSGTKRLWSQDVYFSTLLFSRYREVYVCLMSLFICCLSPSFTTAALTRRRDQ